MKRFLPLLVGLFALFLWEATSRIGLVDPYFLPAPTDIAHRLMESLPNTAHYLGVTVLEALSGSAIGAIVAIPLGYAVAKSQTMARIVEPYAAASQAIPSIALAPLLALWLGYGYVPIVVLCSVMVFFPILLSTTYGLTHIDHDVVDAARLDGAGTWDLLRHIEFPLALPAILTGLRNGVTLSMTGAVVGELVLGGRGLGELLAAQQRANDTVGLFATIAMLVAIAILLHTSVHRVERYLKGQR